MRYFVCFLSFFIISSLSFAEGLSEGFVPQPYKVVENLTVHGWLTKDEVSKAINSYMGQIQYCYERQLQRKADIKGKVVIAFEITGSSGRVENATVSSSTLGSQPVEECITKVFKRISLFRTAKSNTQGTAELSFGLQTIQKK